MAAAVQATLASVTGSSITTIAGFIALCFMTFTMGRDLGIVMAKGVLLGVIGCVTVLPSLILVFVAVPEEDGVVHGDRQLQHGGQGLGDVGYLSHEVVGASPVPGDLCPGHSPGAVRL